MREISIDIWIRLIIAFVLFTTLTIIMAKFMLKLNELKNNVKFRVKMDSKHINELEKLQTTLAYINIVNILYYIFLVIWIIFM